MVVPLRLLMVEDSADDAELIRLELERAGFALTWHCIDTEEDLRSALDEPWDLIISDFQMPRFDGLRAFAVYKERELDTPFIFVSGALGEERAVEAMRVGARDYLVKGRLARLGVAVKRALEEERVRRAQRDAEESAKDQERRLAMAVEASGAGVFEYSIPVGPEAHFSERWAEILGYRPDELPPADEVLDWFFARVDPDDAVAMKRAYEDLLAGRCERLALDARVRHRDETWRSVSCFAKIVSRDARHQRAQVVGVLVDVTERRRLEEQLRQAQKMEAVGRLAGGVAHDFNNLLTVILSFGNFVLEELDAESAASEDIGEVLKAARKAEGLTSQLLAFSRHKPVAPKVMNVNALVADMDRMLRRVVGEDVDVSTTLDQRLWNVRVDPGSLEQVIVNLSVNARDAMPDGGKLTVETANERLTEAYGEARGVEVPPGDYVVIAVSDNGTGMDEATQKRIFEPFFTTKQVGRGTGLGLATCYGIVRQAGGFIWVYSEVGEGTTFKVYLPRVVSPTDAIEETPPPVDLRGSETVLVAEDNEQVRRLAVRALSRLGYDVLHAANGQEALRVAEHAQQPIDLLLTDVVMPEMNGEHLAKQLAETHGALKVVYMSGYTASAMIHRGALDPGTFLLHKPFTPESLGRKIREALDARNGTRPLPSTE